MKSLVPVLVFLCAIVTSSYAQNVGIGNTSPASKVDISGDLALREGTALTVSAGANSLTLPTSKNSVYRLTGASGAFSISSISAGNDGMLLTLINATGQVMTLSNSSTVHTNTGADLVATGTASSVTMIYNTTLGMWSVTAGEGFSSSGGWNLTGNSGTSSSNFVGTTDANPLYIKTNNAQVGFLSVNTSDNLILGLNNGNPSGTYNLILGNSSSRTSMTGSKNVTLGWNALTGATSGSDNIAIGENALISGTSGYSNIGIGVSSLYRITSGQQNVALSAQALYSNTGGSYNLGIGVNSLYSNQTGSNNVALGNAAGYSALGGGNVFLGSNAGYNETGSNKLYISNSNTTTPLIYGDFTNKHLTVHDSLTAKYLQLTNGATAGYLLQSDASGNATWVNPSTVGDTMTLIASNNRATRIETQLTNDSSITVTLGGKGYYTFRKPTIEYNNTGGSVYLGNAAGSKEDLNLEYNTGLGANALQYMKSGYLNVAVGNQALQSDTVGVKNTAVGAYALADNLSGSNNTILGYKAGFNNISGGSNVFLGYAAGINELGSNKLYIDNGGNTVPMVYGDFSNKHVTINDSLTARYLQMTNGATAGYLLQSDASGNANWVSPSSISASNIYNTDGTLTGNRNLNMGGNTLVLTNGTVGITSARMGLGTASPYGNFDFEGTNTAFHLYDFAGVPSVLAGEFHGISNFGPLLRFSGPVSGYMDIGQDSTGSFVINQGSTGVTKFTLNQYTGYVGIGTTTPSSTLQVNGKTTTTNLQMTNGGTNGYILKSDASGNASWVSPGTIAAQNIYNTDGTLTGSRTVTMSGNNLYFTGGNVGVGTTSPNGTLDVLASGGKEAMLGGGSNTGSELKLAYNGIAHMSLYNNNGNLTFANTSTNILANTTGTPLMTLTNGGNLGIGTTSPTTAKLVISGSAGAQGLDLSSTDQYANLRVLQNTNAPYDNDMYIGYNSGTNSSLHLYSNNNETVTIKGGSVGVGTTSPVTLLANTATNIIGTDGNGINTGSLAWVLNNSGYTEALYNASTATGAMGLAVKIAGTSATNKLLDLSTSTSQTAQGTSVMAVFGNGTVGIGTTTPAQTLDVNGTIKSTGFQMPTGAALGDVLQSDASGNASWVAPSSLATNNIYNSNGTLTGNRTVTMGADNLYFTTTGGKIGIGNTSPGATLDVTGNMSVGTSNTNTGTNSVAMGGSNTVSGVLSVVAGGTNNVSGNFSVITGGGGNTLSGSYAQVGGGGNNVTGSYTLVAGGGHTVAGTYSTVFNNTNSTTSSASASLAGGYQSQAASNYAVGLGWADTAYGIASMAVGRNNSAESYAEYAGGTYATLYSPSSTSAIVATDRLFNIGNGTSATARADAFTILKNGNVGIGNNAPGSKLTVSGTTSTTNFQMTNGGTAGYLLQSDASGNASWVAPSSIAANNIYNSNGTLTGARTVTMGGNTLNFSGGNVGIGTASPNGTLAVVGKGVFGDNTVTNNDANDNLYLEKVGSYTQMHLYNNDGSNTDINAYLSENTTGNSSGFGNTNPGLNLWTASAHPIRLATNAVERLTILSGGNIGVSNTSPAYPLDVTGIINTSAGFKVGGTATSGTYLRGNGTAYVSSTIQASDLSAAINGTTNYVAKFTGANTIGNGLMYDNGSQIGINTTTPYNTVDVAGHLGMRDNDIYFRGASGVDMNHGVGWYGSTKTFGTTGFAPDGPVLYGCSGGGLGNYCGTQHVALSWNANGYVGIGTNSASYPLDVETQTGSNGSSFTFYARGCSSYYGCATSASNISIYAAGRMWASEFDATSDRRVKKEITDQSTASSLDKANKLQVVTYKYIDELEKGNKTKTGFIAQAVQDVIPGAVNLNEGFLPSIFELASSTRRNGNELTIVTTKAHGLAAGDIVRLYGSNNEKLDLTVSAISGEHNFTVTGWESSSDSIFVYGKKVNDFRTVDFDQITAVAIGAVQELSKKLTEEQAKNAALQQQLSTVQQQNQSTRTDIDKLKASIETLQQLIGAKAER